MKIQEYNPFRKIPDDSYISIRDFNEILELWPTYLYKCGLDPYVTKYSEEIVIWDQINNCFKIQWNNVYTEEKSNFTYSKIKKRGMHVEEDLKKHLGLVDRQISKYLKYVPDNISKQSIIEASKISGCDMDTSVMKYTYCMIIDVDCHERSKEKDNIYFETLKTLYKHIPLSSNWQMDVRCDGGLGAHIYIKFDKCVELDQIKEFKNQFNKLYENKKYVIETPNTIRLPFSRKYNILINNKRNILYYINRKKFAFIPNVLNFIKNVDNYIEKPLSKIEFDNIINELKEKNKENSIQKNIIPFIKQDSCYQKKRNLSNKNIKNLEIFKSIKVGCGTRHEGLHDLVRYGGKYLNMSINHLIQHTLLIDTGSKDIAGAKNKYKYLYKQFNTRFNSMHIQNNNSSSNIEDNIEWVDTIKPDNFISNMQYVPEYFKIFINTKQTQEIIYKEIKKNILKKINSFKDYQIVVPIIIQEGIGKLIYELNNEKKIKDTIILNKKNKEKALKGFYFSNSMLLQLKDSLEYKKGNIDFRKAYLIALKCFNLFKQNMINTQGYYNLATFKACKHYMLNTNDSINKNNINIKLFNIINNIYHNINNIYSFLFSIMLKHFEVDLVSNMIFDKRILKLSEGFG
jgi:hypothetical protein